MRTIRRTLRVEWAHCDPAKIVFYPQYLIWFDSCTAWLFEAAGLPTAALFAHHNLVGTPLVDVRARFILPSRFGDDVDIESKVGEFRRSSFVVEHRLRKGDALAVECFETRVWIRRHADDPDAMQSQPVPDDVKARFAVE